MHEAAGVTVELANPYWFYPRALVQRQTCRHAQPVPTQPALFQCADGRWVYFALILADQKPWQALVEWMDEPGPGRRPRPTRRTTTSPTARTNFPHIQEIVEVFFLLQDSDDAYHEGQARGLPIGMLNAPEDLYDDEHLVARDVLRRGRPARATGRCRKPGRAVPILGAVDTVAPQPAARLGEHTDDVLGDGREARPDDRRRESTDDRRLLDPSLFTSTATAHAGASPGRGAGLRAVTFPAQASCPRCTG